MTAARKTSKASAARSSGSKSRSTRADKGRTSTVKGKASQAKKTAAKKTTSGTKRSAAGAAKKPTRKPVAKKTTPARKTAAAQSRSTKSTGRKTTAATAGRVVGGRRGQARGTERARVPTRPGPAAKKPAGRPPRPIKLDKKQLANIRAELAKELEDLERQQEELEQSSFTDTQSDLTGEVGLDEDFADAGTATFERERDLSIKNNIRDLIDQVTRAIGRIDEGVYGVCERCGGPIDAARLKALPHAVLCMDCKRREERAR
ncbi:MAG TPA: TraR/DksA C4-type zinc finger protein [Actinomycetota bacterium]|nr:TraR/DksA C4-type zinc finger protein [Actinomycetota bacterium]